VPDRINLVVDSEEKERYRRQAAREGRSLSEWLREAARARLESARRRRGLDTLDELRTFFQACDERETGREPDWAEQRQVIEESIRKGGAQT
jgi:hypothetical protein